MISTSVTDAVRVLESGGVVAIPTETVYGLGALAHDHEAVLRVFRVKGRPTSHPLIVHLGTRADPTAWGVFDDNALRLAAAFWPGPLTLLVPRTALVPDWVTGGRDTVALRVPSHPIARELLDQLADGLVAPSANLFGHVSPTTAQHVENDLGQSIDMILDGGQCTVGVESTIVECIAGRVQILRPGAVTGEDVTGVVGSILDNDLPAAGGESRAPGMLTSHYAPRAKVILCETSAQAQQTVERSQASNLSTYLLHDDDINSYALHLYEKMRDADSQSVAVIVAVLPPAVGLGVAIRDRLQKAAAGN